LESDLPLLLGDVSVKNLSLLLQVGFEQDLIGLFLCLTENDGSAVSSSIKIDEVGDDGVSMIMRAAQGQVFYGLGSSHVRILN
jgi:hypothetical protein